MTENTDGDSSESLSLFRTPLLNAILGSDEDDSEVETSENSENPVSSHSCSGFPPIGTYEANSTLISAIWCGRYELVKLLLNTGADVNKASESFGITPLMQACRCGRMAIVQLLVENGAAVNVRQNKHGATALYWAVKKGNFECVKSLIDHGADVKLQKKTPHDRNLHLLHVAAKTCKVDTLNLLCDNGADVSELDDSFGETPLFNAVRANNFEVVGRLLELGSSVNTVSYDLTTPLHLAAGNVHRNIDILQLLLDNGALVNVKDHRGYIPLMMCLNSSFLDDPGMLSICECLVRHGSLVNDDHCHQALQWKASHFSCFSLVRLCVSAGLNLYKGNWVSLFSQRGNQSDEQAEFIKYIQTHLRNPHTLADLCRVSVRMYLTGLYEGASIYYQIQKLPLPESVVLFLLIEE